MVMHQYLLIDQFVWPLVFCGIRYYQSASMDCSGDIQKIHMRKIRRGQGQVHLRQIWQISCLEDVRQAQVDVSRPRGPRWRAMISYHMARRTGFREQYYTGTRRYKCVREDCRQYQGETIYAFVMVICPYLWINVFVWALVLCGIRYYQFASLDCSGVIQKIHMRKIRRHQGQSTW